MGWRACQGDARGVVARRAISSTPGRDLLGRRLALHEGVSRSESSPQRSRRPTVSAKVPDWSREERAPGAWDPGRSLLAAIRRYQRYRGLSGPVASAARRLAVLEHRFWSAVSGADIPLNAQIEGGLRLPHPSGLVIHPDVKIGPNCILFQQVTLGTGAVGSGVPTLGGGVEVGAGAKILGRVTIGDHAKIGANSVVVRDVPAGAVVVGVPAREIRREEKVPNVDVDNVVALPFNGPGQGPANGQSAF